MRTLPRQRMIHPSVFTDRRLSPVGKRCAYVGAMMLAEDSGCLFWDALNLLDVMPFEAEITEAEVARFMQELEADDYVWTYQVDGVECAYIPSFPHWQQSLTRWNAPRAVPVPPGLCYIAHESQNRYGSVTYKWPTSKTEMLRDYREDK